MDVKFPVSSYGKPFDCRCFMAANRPSATGVQLKAELAKPSRRQVIKTILLVDDNPGYLEIAQMILKDLNIKIVAVDPGLMIREQVIRLIEEHKPDMIVMDGEMPGVSGVELVRELREKFKYNGYIAANSSSNRQMREMERVGADFSIPEKVIFNLLAFFEP